MDGQSALGWHGPVLAFGASVLAGWEKLFHRNGASMTRMSKLLRGIAVRKGSDSHWSGVQL